MFDTVVNTFEMKFENLGFNEMIAAKEARKDASMPIRAATLFEMFPFCVLFNVNMIYLTVTNQVVRDVTEMNSLSRK